LRRQYFYERKIVAALELFLQGFTRDGLHVARPSKRRTRAVSGGARRGGMTRALMRSMSVRVSRPRSGRYAPVLANGHLALAIAVGLTAIMAIKALLPLWLPLLLAAWFAHLARSLSDKLAERLRGRSRAAALVVVLLVLGVLTP